MKQLYLLSLLSVFSAQAMLTEYTKEHVKNVTGYIKPGMYRDAQGFSVMNDGKRTRVNTCDVDKSLRDLEMRKLKKISNYITAHKMSNGDITLRVSPRLNGAGGGGAAVGWWIGWGGANIVAQAGIILAATGASALATVTAGPLAAPTVWSSTFYGLNKALQPVIQVEAAKIGCATSIALGVATGPV